MTATASRNNRSIAGFQPASGHARCLIPLLDALGWRGDERSLYEALPAEASHMGRGELLNTMATLKFAGVSRPGRLMDLAAHDLPCLFEPVGQDPLVIVARGRKDGLAYDGTSGEYGKMPLGEQPGQVIHFRAITHQEDSLLKRQADWSWQLMTRFRGLGLQVVVVTLLLTGLTIATPTFIGQIYNAAMTAGSEQTILYLGLGMILLMLADGGLRFMRSQIFLFLSARIGNVVGNEVLRRLLLLPPAYTETANLGAQVARIKDFDNLREFFSGPALVSLLELPTVALLLLAMAFVGGRIVIVPLLALVLFAAVGAVGLPLVRRSSMKASQAGSAKQTFVVETLTALEAVQESHATRTWQLRYRDYSADAAVATYEAAQITALINAFSYCVVMGAGLLTMGLGIEDVLTGQLQAGALVTAMMLCWRTLAPIGSGFGVLLQVTRIRRSVEQVDRLMNIPLEARPDSSLSLAHELKGQVQVANASLRYTPDAMPALLGISFELAPGQTLAIAGHDGAGKTSLLKLILGLYVPQGGHVLLDGMNVRQLDPMLVRHGIAFAPKAPYLFHGTLRSNLMMAHPAASEDELWQACERAGVIDEIAELPLELDTPVDAQSLPHLSASFQKRVSLARALLRPSKLILLDEPEAQLTMEETLKFAMRLLRDRGDTTIVIATQSLDLMQLTDHLLVLENGRTRSYH